MAENDLGKKLKAERKRRGITQGELARELMISGDYVSKLEKGTREPSPIVADKIVEYLSGNSQKVDNNTCLVVNGHSAHIDMNNEQNLPSDIQVVVDEIGVS